ncbi:hypothetical protein IW138_001841 [Coemansia sp. RSA 986]|nr:hypothetical protein IW138_001841 [Coemansia sp. RSA 986]
MTCSSTHVSVTKTLTITVAAAVKNHVIAIQKDNPWRLLKDLAYVNKVTETVTGASLRETSRDNDGKLASTSDVPVMNACILGRKTRLEEIISFEVPSGMQVDGGLEYKLLYEKETANDHERLKVFLGFNLPKGGKDVLGVSDCNLVGSIKPAAGVQFSIEELAQELLCKDDLAKTFASADIDDDDMGVEPPTPSKKRASGDDDSAPGFVKKDKKK